MGKIIYRFILLLILVLLVYLFIAGCSSRSTSLVTYKLSTEVLEGEGSIAKSPDRGEYKSGTKVTLTAVGKDGWEFYEWVGSIEGNKNPYEVVVNSNMNIGAKFKPGVLPTGVSIDQAYINISNEDALSFTFNGAEAGKTYVYLIDDTNVDTPVVSDSKKIKDSNQQINDIDVSKLDDGILTLTAYLKDESGNQGDNLTDTVLKDTVEPTFPTISGISTGSYNTDQSFKVSGEEGASIEYSLDNGSNWNTYERAVTLSAEGTYEVVVRQRDKAGNISVNSSVIIVTIDKIVPDAPTINGISTGRYNTDQSFTVSGEEGASIEYSLDNGSSWDTYEGAVTLSAEGTYEVVAKQIDEAGIESANSSVITVIIDKTVPDAPIINGISTGSYNTDQSFKVSGEEEAGIEYSLDNGSSWNTYERTVTLSAEGTYEVVARQRDKAGNISVNSSVIIVTINKTGPTVSDISPADGEENVDINITFQITFNESLDVNTMGTVRFDNPAITFIDESNCSVDLTTTVNTDDTLIITPHNPLNEGTIYTGLTISGFRDILGNEMNTYIDSGYNFATTNPASIPVDYIARWRFEGNLYDETGDYNGEVASGMQTPVYNYVYYREGDTSLNVNDANLSTISALPVLSDDSFSISAFFFVDSANMLNYQTLVEHKTISAIYYDIDSSKIIGELLYENIIVEIPSISQDTWHHIVLTYNGSELLFYLNGGIEVYSTTAVDDISLAGERYMDIGGAGTAGGLYRWQGYIDDIIIYDRALTAGEVSNIYDSY